MTYNNNEIQVIRYSTFYMEFPRISRATCVETVITSNLCVMRFYIHDSLSVVEDGGVCTTLRTIVKKYLHIKH